MNKINRSSHPVTMLTTATLIFLLAGCPGPTGPVTITLSGDVACQEPVTVSGNVTQSGTDLLISATVKCNGTGVAGVMLDGVLPVATGNITTRWGPTDGSGTATTSLDASAVAVMPTSFKVIVKDASGNTVTDKDVPIQ